MRKTFPLLEEELADTTLRWGGGRGRTWDLQGVSFPSREAFKQDDCPRCSRWVFCKRFNRVTSKVLLTLNFQGSVVRSKDLESARASILKYSTGSNFPISYAFKYILLIFCFTLNSVFLILWKNLSKLHVLLPILRVSEKHFINTFSLSLSLTHTYTHSHGHTSTQERNYTQSTPKLSIGKNSSQKTETPTPGP